MLATWALLPAKSMTTLMDDVPIESGKLCSNSFLHEVHLSVSETALHVSNANGETLYIYNILGVKVASFKIDSDDKQLGLSLPTGCYILKVGKMVRKISIKR